MFVVYRGISQTRIEMPMPLKTGFLVKGKGKDMDYVPLPTLLYQPEAVSPRARVNSQL